MFDAKKLGQVIRFLRKKKGLTQLQYSTDLDVSPVYLSEIERGARTPSTEVMVIILNSLGMTFSDSFSYFDIESNYLDTVRRKRISTLTENDCHYLYDILTSHELKGPGLKICHASE